MPTKKTKKAAGPNEIKFEYIKSNFYRVIHADGAIGGLTPSGFIQMNLWSQRRPIPQQVVHGIDGNTLGPEISRQGREAVVREIDVGAVLDFKTALALREWLNQQIEALAEHIGARQEEADEDWASSD